MKPSLLLQPPPSKKRATNTPYVVTIHTTPQVDDTNDDVKSQQAVLAAVRRNAIWGHAMDAVGSESVQKVCPVTLCPAAPANSGGFFSSLKHLEEHVLHAIQERLCALVWPSTLQPSSPNPPAVVSYQGLFNHVPFEPSFDIGFLRKKPEPGAKPILESKDGVYQWRDDLFVDFKMLPYAERWSPIDIFGVRALHAAISEAALAYLPKRLDCFADPRNSYVDFDAPCTIGPTLHDKGGILWDCDESFGLQRFQGANPQIVRHVETPTDVTCPPGQRTLHLDYTMLGQYVTCDEMKRSGLQPHCYLSYDPTSGAIVPQSIDIGTGVVAQRGDSFPWRWRYAKLVMQCAEFNHQELVSHLAWKHLVSEVFIVSTMQMWRSHDDNPIYRLLLPSFSRTLAVNEGASILLLPWLGNYLSAYGPDSLHTLVKDAVTKFDCASLDFEKELANRGFDVAALPPTYLFAIDGVRIWRALLQFVRLLLTQNASKIVWSEVAQWSSSICQRVASFPQNITTIDDLASIVAGIIFNDSVAHSAVNDPQYYFFGYVPNAPGRLLNAVPQLQDVQMWTDIDWKRFFYASLPGSKQANFQREMLSVLALNPPEHSSLLETVEDYRPFCDATTVNSLFASLNTIAADIDARGEYMWLNPSQLTRSVIR